MKQITVSLSLRVLAAGLVAGLLACGWGGCSNSGSGHVDVALVRAALAKRRADYGEMPGNLARAREKTPARRP
jgi:hypothetical protein